MNNMLGMTGNTGSKPKLVGPSRLLVIQFLSFDFFAVHKSGIGPKRRLPQHDHPLAIVEIVLQNSH